MAEDSWRALAAELARWCDAGRVADLWLRDDDAVEPTAALDRLLASAGRYDVPATLAVIPAFAGDRLAARLSAAPGVTVAVHGWRHENHAPVGKKKHELGPDRPMAVILDELAMAKATIDGLFKHRAAPLLVPPWNCIGNDLLSHLDGIGFAALSVYGRAVAAPLPVVNTHVDLIDWHGARGCRDQTELVTEVVGELRWRRETGSREPIGILAHHLVHDDAAWAFLDTLLKATAANPGCRWVSVARLI